MEFLNYKNIRGRLNKRSILHKKPNLDEASAQFYSLARKLDNHKIYSGLCHLAVTYCQGRDGQVGAFLNAARAFSQASHEIVAPEYHIQDVKWMYREALLICDKSLIGPIYSELGEFFESHNLHQQAAECFKKSISTTKCVNNYILCQEYEKALEVLHDCPQQSLSQDDCITMKLLELFLNASVENEHNEKSFDKSNLENNLGIIAGNDDCELLPVDDILYDLNGLLESLFLFKKEKNPPRKARISLVIERVILDKLSVFLNDIQLQLLCLIFTNDQAISSARNSKFSQSSSIALACQAQEQLAQVANQNIKTLCNSK